MFDALSDAVEVWHFDMLAPPEESGRKSLDLTFTRWVLPNALPRARQPPVLVSSQPGITCFFSS